MEERVLGLDLGPNSIGWALLDFEDGKPKGIIDCGTRIFQEAVDKKTKVPKNAARRDARSARKLVSRSKMRRNTLKNILKKHELIPPLAEELELLFKSKDPYLLRKKGLYEKLELFEIGRILYHLNQRRGFKSNRKTQLAELVNIPEFKHILENEDKEIISKVSKKKQSDDEGVIKKAISELKTKIIKSKSKTLGEYLASQRKKRGTYTDRSMLEEEFDSIWDYQANYYPDKLTIALKAKVFQIVFFQRPLKLQKFLVGKCTFEPSRKRAPKALYEFQQFRILQDLNNLRIKDPIQRTWRPLRKDEREKLKNKLMIQEKMNWNSCRRLLGLHDGELFNFEAEGKEITGNRTNIKLKKALPEIWEKLSREEQKSLIEDLLTIQKKDVLIKRVMNHWKLTPEQAFQVAITELEPGYASLSQKAINKLLPFLDEGLDYHDACQKAGYQRDDQKEKEVYDKLPEPRLLRNPVVQKALFEVRKVINSLVEEYGKPNVIRVELARDLKRSKKEKERFSRQNRINEALNKEAEEVLNELNFQNPSGEDKLKYRLWKECEGICPYTGQSIGLNMLFGPDVDIEHIIPFSRSIDDSYLNKTLCMAKENRTVKKNRTPFEAYSGDTIAYQELLQRVGHMTSMPFIKKKRFEMTTKEVDELIDNFVSRQLNETRYISVEVKNYIQSLGCKTQVGKGEITSILRWKWGLNRILADDDSNSKNRENHKHHAIDAVVISLTTPSLIKRISDISRSNMDLSIGHREFPMELPWPSFWHDTKKAIDRIIVSHAMNRKITGAFHEETAYGYDEKKDIFVYRKPVEALTTPMVTKIRDSFIRSLVEERLSQFGGDAKKAFAEPLFHKNGKTPIRTVRITANFDKKNMLGIGEGRENSSPYKFFSLGNNHHVEIVENESTRKGVFVSTVEAAKRARILKVPIVNKVHGEEWKFIMSLANNDMVEIIEEDEKFYYRVQKLTVTGNITFRLHHVATTTGNDGILNKNANTLRCKKVQVSPIGRISYCND